MPPSSPSRTSDVRRRALVRTGVAAAWSAPLVLAVTEPAHATSCSGPITGSIVMTAEFSDVDIHGVATFDLMLCNNSPFAAYFGLSGFISAVSPGFTFLMLEVFNWPVVHSNDGNGATQLFTESNLGFSVQPSTCHQGTMSFQIADFDDTFGTKYIAQLNVDDTCTGHASVQLVIPPRL